jgi:hypothetical protein
MKGASVHRGGTWRARGSSVRDVRHSRKPRLSSPRARPFWSRQRPPTPTRMVYYGQIYAYPIVALPNLDQIVLSLNDGDPDDNTITIPQDFNGKNVQSAFDFHQTLNHEEQDAHPILLIILDTQDVPERGVLIVNLNYHNTIDALRMPAAEAGISVCSLSVDNTTWQEARESCNDQYPPLAAAKQFLVYGLKLDSEDLEISCQSMNDGLGALNAQEQPGGFAEYRSIYVKGPREHDLGDIKTRHCRVSKEMGCSESMFAVVERDCCQEGVLLVKLDAGSDHEHVWKKLPIAGEILNWVYLGLWSWQEVFKI